MAGAKNFIFKEKLSREISDLMKVIESTQGRSSRAYKALESQYIKSPLEDSHEEFDRMRHYQSEVHIEFEGKRLKGVERLYERTILIEPSSVCAAHCRWCLRRQYPVFSLREEEITNFARYAGSNEVRDELREILITGGDPFMVPQRLQFIITEIKKHAPNIKIVRIGTRVPVQDPGRVNSELLEILQQAAPLKIEVATHVNHPVELTIAARKAYEALYEVVFKIYDQSVLLKGVNDNHETLRELYDHLRYLGIEAHYLFHCIPMRGMSHHRTSVQKGLDLINRLTASGDFSGRAKPMFTLMTDLGKISLYQGAIIEKNKNNEILIQSHYRISDLLRRNPTWKLPEAAHEDKNGYLRVWYPDGND